MNNTNRLMSITLVGAFAILPAFALNHTWGPVNDDLNGSWTEVKHWTFPYGNAVPTKSGWGNASAKIDCRGSYEVTIPAARQTVATAELMMNVQSGETLKLNVREGGFLLGNQGKWSESYFGSEPIQFNCASSPLMELHAASSTGSYDDMLELTNTVVTLAGGTGSGALTFDGGLVDFLDPCGVTWKAATKPTLVFHRSALDHSSVVFTNGASLRGHNLRLQECAATNVLAFVGGEHCVGSISIPSPYNYSFAPSTTADTTFLLSDGAKMSAESVSIGTKGSSGGTERKTTHFVVEGEGTSFAATGEFENFDADGNGAGRAEIVVRNGAKLAIGKSLTLNSQAGATATVSVVDATLSAKTKFAFGKYATSSLAFGATNALIETPRCDILAGGTLSLHDTVWTNCATLNLGASPSAQSAPVSFSISGDAARFGTVTSYFNVGGVELSTLRLDGGTAVCRAVKLSGTAGGRLELLGGCLSCNQLYGSTGTSEFLSDGGLLVPRQDSDYLLYGITDARLGSQGLTVASDYTVLIAQSFANKTGVTDGALILTGTGTKKLTAATSDEGRLVVSGGALLLAPASGTTVSHANADVVATNAASLGFAATVTAVTFKSLRLGSDVTDACLTLYSGTRLAVDTLALGRFTISLGDTFATDTTYPVITVKGRVDAATASAWKTAYIASGRTAEVGYVFEVSDYDETSGTTVLSIVTTSGFTPSVANVWQGAATGDASWTNAANWSAATLDKTTIATFAETASSVATSVDLPDAAVVGAVAFANRDYRISGSGALVIADSKNGSISVASGHPSIDVPLYLSDTLSVSVAKNASLALEGAIHHGGINKTGDGALFLNGAGSLLDKGFTANGGLFSFGDLSGLSVPDSVPGAFLRDGTLQIGGDPADGERVFPFTLTCSGAEKTTPLVLSNAVDVVLPGASVSSGALIKRGGGTATFDIARYTGITKGNGAGTGSDGAPTASLDFPADGTAPSGGYSGLTVFEGEFRARTAEGTAAVQTADAMHQTVLGTWSGDSVSVPPTLTADRTFFQNYFVFAGLNAYVGEYPENARTQYIRAVNGGTLQLDTLRVGQVADAKKATYDTLLDIEADGGTFQCGNKIQLRRTNAALRLRAKNGGVLGFGKAPLALTGVADFDGGLWKLASSAPSKVIAFSTGIGMTLAADGGGMGFEVPADTVWQLYHPVGGSGGIFKRGEGTLRVESAAGYKADETTLTNFVDACVLCCTGTNRVEAGTLVATAGADGARFDVSSGATLRAEGTVTGLAVSGAGTLAGGVFAKLTLFEADGNAPTLDGLTASGTVKVDLGRDAEHPLETLPKNLKVANLTENPSSISRWKLVGTGLKGIRGTFRTDGNAVYMDAAPTGFLLLVR